MTLFSILFSKNLKNIPFPSHYHCFNSVSHLVYIEILPQLSNLFPIFIYQPHILYHCLLSTPVAVTKSHRLGTYKQQTFIFHSPRSQLVQKPPADLASGKGHFLDYRWQLFTMSPYGRGDKVSLWTLFDQAIISYMRVLPLRPSHLPKTPPLISLPQYHIHLGGMKPLQHTPTFHAANKVLGLNPNKITLLSYLKSLKSSDRLAESFPSSFFLSIICSTYSISICMSS